jgi:hypothetical protein
MPTDDCIGLDDRPRIANFRKQSIETNKYQSIKNTKGLPSRRRSPQNVDLLPKHPDLCLQCCPRSHQIDERPENQPAKIRHHAVTSADSPLLANWIRFTIGEKRDNQVSNQGTGDEVSSPQLDQDRANGSRSFGMRIY